MGLVWGKRACFQYISSYILMKCEAWGFFFRVHSGKVIISMDILVYGKCNCMLSCLIRKTRSLLQGICTCLKYCFDELKRQQLNFRIENPFLFSSSILNSHLQVSEFGWLLSVHSQDVMYKVVYSTKTCITYSTRYCTKNYWWKRMKWTSGRNNDIDTAAYLPAHTQWYDHICYERNVQIMRTHDRKWCRMEVEVLWRCIN